MISSYKELLDVKSKFPVQFAEYIEEEFLAVYDYLSNDENLNGFLLSTHHTMVVLESDKETNEIWGAKQ